MSWGHRLFGGGGKKSADDEKKQEAYASHSGAPAFAPPSGPPPAAWYAPPAGPPATASYAPPAGPPPSTYLPPAAPPPQASYAAPPGPAPPPSYEEIQSQFSSMPEPLAPPPPVLSYLASPALNASEDEFEGGERFIDSYPLAPPRHLSMDEARATDEARFTLLRPPNFDGEIVRGGDGTSLVRASYTRDTTIIPNLPLFSATRRAAPTVYYEIQIVKLGRDGSVVIGMCAVPYPPFRLPGWHRASIGVHADDGHRYSCDSSGGLEFTEPFVPGDVLGLGLELHTSQVWFTRNGVLAGGWNLREGRTDEADSFGVPWDGLDGTRDIYAAIGICGEAQAIVNVGGERSGKPWMWRPVF
ncbi:hypothetical protein BKA62DRAFT_440758 [Auriculariales sp. MPI-PUGE-AT-0066]|nr:hypothetical protein BKA62DRAFT_440758 [Auriculariales sp. MPI-PUGE-AT-0066]